MKKSRISNAGPRHARRLPGAGSRGRLSILRCRVLTFLLALSLVSAIPVAAQDMEERAVAGRFRHLSSVDGLPNPRVFALEQDRDGFLWVGTQNGLGRFDGHEYKNFNTDSEDLRLPDGYITALRSSSRGGLWIGTVSGMVTHLDAGQGRLSSIPVESDPKCQRAVRSIVEVGEEAFFGGSIGLQRLMADGSTSQLLPSEPCPAAVVRLMADADETLWIGVNGDPGAPGLYAWDRKQESLVAQVGIGPLLTFCPDGDEHLVLGVEKGGLLRFDLRTREAQPLRIPGMPKVPVNRCLVDSRGHLWLSVGVLQSAQWPGLVEITAAEGEIIQHRPDRYLPGRPSDTGYLAIFEDRSGVLWFGGVSRGLDRLDPREHNFEILKSHPQNPFSLASDHVLSFTESEENGDIWVGYFGAGIQRLDSERRPLETYPPGADGPGSGYIWDLHLDELGDLWIAHETGLTRRSRHGEFAEVLGGEPPTTRSLTLHRTGNGELWVGGADFVGRIERGPEPAWRLLPDATPASILAMKDDGDTGGLWLGFNGAGLGRLDTESGALEFWGEEVLGHGVVSSLIPLSDGVVLVATLGAGIVEIDREDGALRRWTVSNGLASNAVKSVLQDETGVIWAASELMLHRLDLDVAEKGVSDTGDIARFGVGAGEHALGFATKAALRGSQRLWFGGKNGLVSFDPKGLMPEIPPPPAFLTWLEILHRRVGVFPEDPDSPLHEVVNRVQEIELGHRDRIVSIGFAALDFGTPRRQLFRYQLEGFDPHWVEKDAGERFARYSNLPPGKFRFQVQASLDGQTWGERALLEIRVRPPWWRSSVAYLAYAGLTLSLLGWAYERQRRQVKTLGGLLPICASCKRIRDDEGYWQEVEAYVSSHSSTSFSHGLCPGCFQTTMEEADLI